MSTKTKVKKTSATSAQPLTLRSKDGKHQAGSVSRGGKTVPTSGTSNKTTLTTDPLKKINERTWKIRKATFSDLPALARIDKAIYVLETPWNLKEFKEDFSQPKTLYLVAEDGEKIVGYAAANIVKGVGGLLMSTVIPEYRRQGIAKEFLNIRLKWLDSKVKETILETRVGNKIIQDSYKAYGFQATRLLKDYYAPGVDAIEMRRSL